MNLTARGWQGVGQCLAYLYCGIVRANDVNAQLSSSVVITQHASEVVRPFEAGRRDATQILQSRAGRALVKYSKTILCQTERRDGERDTPPPRPSRKKRRFDSIQSNSPVISGHFICTSVYWKTYHAVSCLRIFRRSNIMHD